MSISQPTEEPLYPIEPGAEQRVQSAASKLFDLRLLIGGLFVFYGVVLIITGLLASSAELHKAAGININLWMGIGMLVLGALFLLWRQVSPLASVAEPAPAEEQPRAPRGVANARDSDNITGSRNVARSSKGAARRRRK